MFADARTDTETRNAYARALHALGWTLQSISQSAGITRERVRQIVKLELELELEAEGDPVDVSGYPLPEPPEHQVKPKPVYVEPDAEKLARLLELQPLAQKARRAGSKYEKEGDEYSRLVAEVHLDDGVTLYRLAKRLGVSHAALRFRLSRYQYKVPANGGTSQVYRPLLRITG